jgi:tRNA A-37 threonylcarbamoyl transferase component Bud32
MSLSNRYRIDGPLGSGGVGEVYKGRHLKLGVDVAIKKLRKEQCHSELLLREVEILKTLKHVGLPMLYDLEDDEEAIYIIQEYIEGHTLKQAIENKKRLAPAEIMAILSGLLPILEYLHCQSPKPIIHRDIKPDNVMLCGGEIKLIDFGIARAYNEKAQEDTQYLGTKGYAAPEQFGRGQSDCRTDIYGLGMTMKAMLYGLDFEWVMEDVEAYTPKDDEDAKTVHLIGAVAKKATQFLPDDRYRDVIEMKRALFVDSYPVTQLLRSETQLQREEKLDFSLDAMHCSTSASLRGRRLSVAVQGALPGIGVTHLLLTMAFTLSRMGYKVCLIYDHSQTEYVALHRYYEEMDPMMPVRVNTFQIEGISFFGGMDQSSLGRALSTQHDVFLYDCGSKTKTHPEWLRANSRILLFGSAIWQLEHNRRLSELYAETSDKKHLFSPGGSKAIAMMTDALDWDSSALACVPLIQNPFGSEQLAQRFVEELLGLGPAKRGILTRLMGGKREKKT